MKASNERSDSLLRSCALRLLFSFVAILVLGTFLTMGDPSSEVADPLVDLRRPMLKVGSEIGLYEKPSMFWGGLPALPGEGGGSSMENKDGTLHFEISREREPVFRPFWKRVGERVKVNLRGSLLHELDGLRLVARDGTVVDETKISSAASTAAVEGYVADRHGGYEVHLLDRGSLVWRSAWSWGFH